MIENPYRKFRWSKVYESSEEELVDYLHAKGIEAETWAADEFHDFGGQVAEHDITIFCAEGSLTFEIGTKKISVQPGDAVRIDANTGFAAVAGMSGCICYEVTS